MFWDFVLCAFCIHVLDVRYVGLYFYVLGLCYVPSICRYKTLYIIGGQHDELCPFWQPARSIFTVLLCYVCFFRANKLSLSLFCNQGPKVRTNKDTTDRLVAIQLREFTCHIRMKSVLPATWQR